MKAKFLILNSLILMGAVARADQPSVHGMALFGDQQLYASHLPMFHAPHDYQLIFELSLKETHPGVLEKFSYEKKNGQTFFTIEPQRMDLTKVLSGEIKEFSSQLYSGHFERGGKALGAVSVQVGKILLKSKLETESTVEDKYLVFGSSGSYFAAHVIQGKPNLDHIVKVAQPFYFSVPFCGRGDCRDPKKHLLDDSQLPLQLAGKKSGMNIIAPGAGEHLGTGSGIKAQIVDVIYSETNELSH